MSGLQHGQGLKTSGCIQAPQAVTGTWVDTWVVALQTRALSVLRQHIQSVDEGTASASFKTCAMC